MKLKKSGVPGVMVLDGAKSVTRAGSVWIVSDIEGAVKRGRPRGSSKKVLAVDKVVAPRGRQKKQPAGPTAPAGGSSQNAKE